MKKILTFGVFDLLHVGHVNFLESARGLGDHLTVAIPTGDVVHLDKGSTPVIPTMDRAKLLHSLSVVESVIIYNDLDFLPVLETVNPGSLVVGGDWGDEKRHREALEWCREHETEVVRLDRHGATSTSAIKRKVVELWISNKL